MYVTTRHTCKIREICDHPGKKTNGATYLSPLCTGIINGTDTNHSSFVAPQHTCTFIVFILHLDSIATNMLMALKQPHIPNSVVDYKRTAPHQVGLIRFRILYVIRIFFRHC
jgi:hypothetical protein